jgi:hypothetical protein
MPPHYTPTTTTTPKSHAESIRQPDQPHERGHNKPRAHTENGKSRQNQQVWPIPGTENPLLVNEPYTQIIPRCFSGMAHGTHRRVGKTLVGVLFSTMRLHWYFDLLGMTQLCRRRSCVQAKHLCVFRRCVCVCLCVCACVRVWVSL